MPVTHARTPRMRRNLERLLRHTYTRTRLVADPATRDAYNQPAMTTVTVTAPCLYDEQGRFADAGFLVGGIRAVSGDPHLVVARADTIKPGDTITAIVSRDGVSLLAEETLVGVVNDVAPNGDVLWRLAKLNRREVVP